MVEDAVFVNVTNKDMSAKYILRYMWREGGENGIIAMLPIHMEVGKKKLVRDQVRRKLCSGQSLALAWPGPCIQLGEKNSGQI